uniref:Reverse transcriptase domain-containing protein n=1 Tax=Tanacetum cinerariifolium TaxID=118510 RepID=A0A6L2NWI7_TANCI|nr:reverse transcriptase domain-containing protein [Tanacetum cinerariifolium]
MQTNQFAGAVFAIPGIVQHYMDQRMYEAVKVAVQIQSDRLREEAQRENDEFLKNVDENINKIIKEQVKEQVKAQVSKILPRIEQVVNARLEAEVLTRSSHSSRTSYVVAADLSEMELKKILIEKMEGNKSIQCSDEQRNLYKALVNAYESDKIILNTYGETVILKRRRDDDEDKDEESSAGPDRGSKRRREGKEPNSASAPSETATRSTGRSTTGSRSQQASASEYAFAEEPMQTTSQMEKPLHPEFDTAVHRSIQPWKSELPKQADTHSSFNELMDTPLDFSNFIMNQLRVDTLTLELLVGPTYDLMKGSCKSLIELEYHLEEVYKATTDQLDWVNLEGQQHPHNLLQPLPLIPDNRGHRVIPFAHFINNDLEYLHGGASSLKYTTLVTKTKPADYGHIKWIEDLVPRTMWIHEPIDYDKHALWGVSHWGRKRQQFYGFAVNQESARDVYSKRRIITVTELKIVEWHSYKHLDWITHRHPATCGRTSTGCRKLPEEAQPYEAGYLPIGSEAQGSLYYFDGTLIDVCTALDDHLKGIRMQYLPQTIWRKSGKNKAAAMIQAIDKRLKTRRIMRILESINHWSHNSSKSRRRTTGLWAWATEDPPVDPPEVPMADNRTMAELLQAPTEGYEDAIVIPEIAANNFELKHGLINLPGYGLKRSPSIHSTWDNLVTKFINQFFPHLKTKNLRNEITRFQQRFDESFYEAWDRFNDLLRACPHHGFSELHQLDTLYNALNVNDQDSLNSAAGGNFLDKMPRECLKIIESKSKVRQSRAKAVIAKVSTSSSTPAVSSEVSELKDMVRALLLDKKNQSSSPASSSTPTPVKAIEPNCVTCGGAHSYQNCPATSENVYRYNIQEVSQAAAANYNQGNTGMDECLALADLGASINLMPLFVWEGLSHPELTPTCMTLELADRSVSKPIGIAKDVSVKVGVFHFPADFVVVDFEPDSRVPLILGRCFLKTDRALIDVHKGELTLRIENEAITYNLDQTVRYSANYYQITANKIGVICEMYSQEVLGFSDATASRNLTPYDDPIVLTTSPSLTPFGDSDFLLFEEVDAFLGLEDDPNSSKFNPFYYDPEGDILLLEAILNSEPLPPLPNQEQYMPSYKKELKVCEAKTIKSFIDEPPEVELKDLPPHLEYAFLEGDNKLLIIIAKELGDEKKSALIKVLKSHKRAIAWKLSDIQGSFTVVENEKNELIPTRLVTEWRVCIDYRKLNEATRKDHFLLPFMDQMLERLAGNEYYCFLDGFFGYFQIPIDPRDQEKTTFTCPYGTFAYRRMPFGLCNAPGTFQRCMLAIFHDMIEKTMEVFMDDFLVFGNSFENCLSCLDIMLQRCEDTNLSLNWEKSHFMVKEGIVLGHKISKNQIEVDRAKFDVIAKLPHLTTVKVSSGPLVKGKQEKDKIGTKPDKNGKRGRARQCKSPVTVKKTGKEKKIKLNGPILTNPGSCI